MSRSLPASMKRTRSLTLEERANRYRRGSEVDTESVISGFFVGGHVGVKSERECVGKKKREGCGQRPTTGRQDRMLH